MESQLDAVAGSNASQLGGVDREDLRQQGKGLLARLGRAMGAIKGEELDGGK